MKIIITEIKEPQFTKFELSNPNLKVAVKESSKVEVHVENNDKTNVFITFHYDKLFKNGNYIPEASSKFKFKEEKQPRSQYFKILRSQGKEELKEHVQNLAHHMFGDLKLETLDLSLYISPQIVWK